MLIRSDNFCATCSAATSPPLAARHINVPDSFLKSAMAYWPSPMTSSVRRLWPCFILAETRCVATSLLPDRRHGVFLQLTKNTIKSTGDAANSPQQSSTKVDTPFLNKRSLRYSSFFQLCQTLSTSKLANLVCRLSSQGMSFACNNQFRKAAWDAQYPATAKNRTVLVPWVFFFCLNCRCKALSATFSTLQFGADHSKSWKSFNHNLVCW